MMTKSQNLLRLLLIIPYLAWGVGLLFVHLLTETPEIFHLPTALFNAVVGVASIYTVGIVIWGIPFTVLIVGLLLWSIKKPAPIIFKVFAFSPFLLSILIAIEVALISFLPPQAPFLEGLMRFLSYILITVIPTLVFGYGFVGMGVIIYKAMNHLNPMKTKGETK